MTKKRKFIFKMPGRWKPIVEEIQDLVSREKSEKVTGMPIGE